MIRILNSSLDRLGVIKNAIKSKRLEEINGENVLDFEAVLDTKLHTLIDQNTIFEIGDDYFDIAILKKTVNDESSNRVMVEAEHVSYRLNNEDYNVEFFTETGTPSYILGQILVGTGFTVGTISFTDATTYSALQPMSRRQVLMEFVAELGGEIQFNKFAVNILTQRGTITPRPAIKDRNVKVITKTINKRDKNENGDPLITYECIPIYIPGTTYTLGDNILLIQKDLGIVDMLRVVRIAYNPYDELDTEFVFANYSNGLESQIYKIITSSVVKDKLYNGCRIGPEYGFEAIRSDKKARSYFKSDGIHFQKGDGTGGELSWTDALWFDDIDGTLHMIGAISWGSITDPPEIPPGFTWDQWKAGAIANVYIDSENIWTPNVYATNISVLNGKIVNAQIDSLAADKITAGTINVDVDIIISNEDSSVVIDSDGIKIEDGKISIKNKGGTETILDAYGIDPNLLDYFKNMVFNSSFELFDTTHDNQPRNWTAGVSDPNANFHGSYSMRLTPGQSSMQTTGSAEINPNWYGNLKTRVAFHRKSGQVKIEVYDQTNHNYFTLTADDGVTTGLSITTPVISTWLGSRASVSFDPNEAGHAGCKYRIKFTNVHATEDCYIDAVQSTVDFTGKWPQLYKDGPKSNEIIGTSEQLDFSKNMIFNSSFELFNAGTFIPESWDGGISTNNTSRSVGYSLKLEPGQTSMQTGDGVISLSSYEGSIARVSFHCKT